MNEPIKKEWVAELRSGNYKQGQLKLRWKDDNRYCCLGVLCEVVGVTWTPDTFNEFYTVDGSAEFLPIDIRQEIGLTPEEMQELAQMNDDMRWSFEQIADWIEENL